MGEVFGDLRWVTDVITRSGSLYRVGRDGRGQWWLQAANVPNPHSCRLPPSRWWRVQQPMPWPPELGERLWLLAPESYAMDDPHRIPGGGKHTSVIRIVRRRAPMKEERARDLPQ